LHEVDTSQFSQNNNNLSQTDPLNKQQATSTVQHQQKQPYIVKSNSTAGQQPHQGSYTQEGAAAPAR
jgi:hypothetical protein